MYNSVRLRPVQLGLYGWEPGLHIYLVGRKKFKPIVSLAGFFARRAHYFFVRVCLWLINLFMLFEIYGKNLHRYIGVLCFA